MTDLQKASEFMQTHARVLDRRRFELLTGAGDPDGALSALAAYANADGGFGWALEPDLRDRGSQPAGALHAFEVLEEIAPATSSLAGALCGWLEAVCGMAHRVARHDPAVAGHPWLARATDFCLRRIAAVERSPFAIELRFVLHFLDAIHDRSADAARELEHEAAEG